MNIFESAFLGIVQGLTEFLPISSTAHLRIVPSFLGWQDPGTAFSAVIQLGTMLSVIIYFWKDLARIYGSLIKETFYRQKKLSQDSKLALWILLGTIPISIFGLLFKDPIEQGLVRNLNMIAFHLIFFALLLSFSEYVSKQNKSIAKINVLDVLLIGLAQSFALIPGVSRSAVTIMAGLLLGFKRSESARFSFLLSVPAVLLSGLLELRTLFYSITSHQETIVFADMLVGLFFACVSGYLTIGFLLKYLQTHRTYVFVVYRILLGILIICLSYRGLIH